MIWIKNQKLNDRYTIIDDVLLKTGDFINTYNAIDISGKNVIIETLDGGYFLHSIESTERQKIENLFREKGTKLSQCRSRHIASYEEPFQEGKLWCIASECVQGVNFSTLSRSHLSQEEALEWIKQLCEGLKELHKYELLHLNINPENIIKRHDRKEVVLTGFSFIKDYGRSTTIPPREKYAEYNAIELFGDGHKANQQSDIYSLAVILYFFLTGNHIQLATDRRSSPALSFSDDLVIDHNVRNAIEKGASLHQKDRPRSVEKWLELLEQKSNRFAWLEPISSWNSFTFEQKLGIWGLVIALLAAIGGLLQGLGAWKDKQDTNSSPTPSQVSTPSPTNSSNK
jgi:serine/threonine-protein kinase